VPLDEVRGWWRYHQLFADLLRARLAHQQTDCLPELHRAAATWRETHGLVDDAVRHALAAVGVLPARPVVHLDAGYDYQSCRQALAARGMAGEMPHAGGLPDPGRPAVGDRGAAIVCGRLVRHAWTCYRWDRRPPPPVTYWGRARPRAGRRPGVPMLATEERDGQPRSGR
jgi:LuxR family transcriptional regulator, maltose regulon positive regulatory protein